MDLGIFPFFFFTLFIFGVRGSVLGFTCWLQPRLFLHEGTGAVGSVRSAAASPVAMGCVSCPVKAFFVSVRKSVLSVLTPILFSIPIVDLPSPAHSLFLRSLRFSSCRSTQLD